MLAIYHKSSSSSLLITSYLVFTSTKSASCLLVAIFPVEQVGLAYIVSRRRKGRVARGWFCGWVHDLRASGLWPRPRQRECVLSTDMVDIDTAIGFYVMLSSAMNCRKKGDKTERNDTQSTRYWDSDKSERNIIFILFCPHKLF